jgi:ubiquinone/menaquinone biosynthesis C-methylase UbiE
MVIFCTSGFGKWSGTQIFRRHRPWFVLVQRQVLDRIDWSRTHVILDVACGSGRAAREASRRLQRHGDAIACGCDLSGGMLQQRFADGPVPANAHFAVASAQRLPFRDHAFGAITCTAAFHHFPVPQQALVEFRRLLRPDGALLISDTCRDLSLAKWVWDRLRRWFEPGHVKYYRTVEIIRLLRNADFQDIEMTVFAPSYAESRKLFGSVAIFSAKAPHRLSGDGS